MNAQSFDKNDPDASWAAIQQCANYPTDCFEELILIGKLTRDEGIRAQIAEVIATHAPKDVQKVWKNRKKLDAQLHGMDWAKAMFSYARDSSTLDIGRMYLLTGFDSIYWNESYKEDLPEEIGRFRGIRSLDISSRYVTRIPSTIGLLQSLEELEIEVSLPALPLEIGQLASLKSLKLNIGGLETFPEAICELSCLQSLELTGKDYTYLQQDEVPYVVFPASFSRLKHLRKLRLCYLKVKDLPGSMFDLPLLEEMSLARMLALKTLPEGFAQLRSLKNLEIYTSPHFEFLPKALDTLPALSQFKIGSLPALKEVSGNLLFGPAMETFGIGQECNVVITPTDCKVSLQRKVYLENTTLIQAFFDHIPLYQHLEDLHIRIFDPQLVIPDAIGSLPKLQNLTLGGTGILALPAGMNGLGQLKKLEVRSNSLLSFPSLKDCGQLRHIVLDTPALSLDLACLPMYLESAKITCLAVTQTSNLPRKFDSLYLKTKELNLDFPSALTIPRLYVEDAPLPSNMHDLQGVVSLAVHSKHLVVPPRIGEMQSLRHLSLSTEYSYKTEDFFLTELPVTMAALQALETLRLTGVMLEDLPFLGQLKSLRSLQLRCFPRLKQVPASIAALPQLENLSLVICPALEDIAILAQIPSLLQLDLASMDTLSSKAFEVLTQLDQLQYLRIHSWKSLNEIPAGIQQMRGLRTLNLSHLSLQTVTESIAELPLLEELWLDHISSLETIPAAYAKIPLQRLFLGMTTFSSLPSELKAWNLKELRMWQSRFAGHNMKHEIYEVLISPETKVLYKDSSWLDVELFPEVSLKYV